MPWLGLESLLALPAFALVLLRISGLVMTAPILSSGMIPVRVRAAMVVAMAAMIFPTVAGAAPRSMTLGDVAAGGASEIMIGAVIGLALSLLVMTGEVAGRLVGQQSGLALGQILDPAMNQQASIIGQFYTIVLTLIFLIMGGHRAAVAAVLDTYRTIPLNTFSVGEPVLMLFIEALTAAFMLGVRLAAPVMIALFLSGTALAILSRTMPQLNILTVGFVIRVLVTLVVAGLALAGCQDPLVESIRDALERIRELFGLGPLTGGLTT